MHPIPALRSLTAPFLVGLLVHAGAAGTAYAGPTCSISTFGTYTPGGEITLEGQCLDEEGTPYPESRLGWVVEHNRDTVRTVAHFEFGKAISSFTSAANEGAMDWYFVKLTVADGEMQYLGGTDAYLIPETGETSILSLGAFSLTEYANGHGPMEIGTSVGEEQPGDGNPITLRGGVYDNGVGVHAGSDVGVKLDYRCAYFISDIGVDDEKGGAGSVVFKIKAEDSILYASGLLTGGSPVERIAVKLPTAPEIRLLVEDGDDGINSDHADWAGAHLICATAATGGPTAAKRAPGGTPGLGLGAAFAAGALRFQVSLPAGDFTVLELHDASGRLLARPISGRMAAGTHSVAWKPAASAPAGVVLATLRSGRLSMTKKVAGGMQ